VALLARGKEGLDAARNEVEAAGGEALVIPTDVADYDQIEAAAERVERAWGPVDIWINNAMVTVFSPFIDITPQDYRRVTDVTYLGYVWGTLAALKRMKPRGRGTIIQVGSALSYRAIPLQSAYCGAKFAIRGFTDAIRSELIHDRSHVHITMVQLSAFNTPQFEWGKTTMAKQPQPLPPIFQPEIAAEAVVWAAQHRRREVWVGFPAVKAILANQLMAPVLDLVLAHKAYKGQCADQPLAPHRRDNLYQPVPGLAGTHGRFDDQARTKGWQWWASTRRGFLLSALLALVAGTVVVAQLG